eukprot:m.80377 g.80377  ORF g.80377 m.80377 type:complete len:309 (+) comp10902_c0_seq1:227-1153(+)
MCLLGRRCAGQRGVRGFNHSIGGRGDRGTLEARSLAAGSGTHSDLRRSAKEGNTSRGERLVGSPPTKAGVDIGVGREGERIPEHLNQLVQRLVVSKLGRSVRPGQQPLSWDIERRGPRHLGRGPFGHCCVLRAQRHPGLEPLGPLGPVGGKQCAVVGGGGQGFSGGRGEWVRACAGVCAPQGAQLPPEQRPVELRPLEQPGHTRGANLDWLDLADQRIPERGGVRRRGVAIESELADSERVHGILKLGLKVGRHRALELGHLGLEVGVLRIGIGGGEREEDRQRAGQCDQVHLDRPGLPEESKLGVGV